MNANKFIDATQHSAIALDDTLAHLNELIVALDRRMPQMQRAGESAIANAAAELRTKAVQRIGELRKQMS